jgi:hypothetical protein
VRVDERGVLGGERLDVGVPGDLRDDAGGPDDGVGLVGAVLGGHLDGGVDSVVAKVARDAHVEALAAEHAALVDTHGGLGSGYPSDPVTRSFLESYVDEHGAVPPFARASWATCEDLLAGVEQSGLDEF